MRLIVFGLLLLFIVLETEGTLQNGGLFGRRVKRGQQRIDESFGIGSDTVIKQIQTVDEPQVITKTIQTVQESPMITKFVYNMDDGMPDISGLNIPGSVRVVQGEPIVHKYTMGSGKGRHHRRGFRHGSQHRRFKRSIQN
ncbi:hypothetical protein RB195_016327 [Necator americanus]|uniref:Uncharacterized protein n=1 Tax=Necator americanus TaxID=51031 RepID=A0ABR1E8M3_NECAM